MKRINTIAIGLVALAVCGFINAQAPIDFDSDGVSDFGVVRDVFTGEFNQLDWHIRRSSDGVLIYSRFGLGLDVGAVDILTPADFDNDGKTDIAIWRGSSQPGMSAYYILKSTDGTVRIENFGQLNDDASAVGDYDGDEIVDLGVYRVTTNPRGKGSGFFYRGSRHNPTGVITVHLIGGQGSERYPGDFDGDGKLDFCVRYRPTGVFTLKRSSDLAVETINWGVPNDWFVPGDFDGDRKSDFAVIRRAGTELHWYILERDGGGTGATPIVWGGDPAGTGNFDNVFWAGDYDRDLKTDIAVTRNAPSSEGGAKTFLVRRSTDGSLIELRWGLAGDRIVQAP